MHVSQKNLEKKIFFRIFWVSLRVLVSMESTIWVRAAPVQCEYGTRTRTVRVFGNTKLNGILKMDFFVALRLSL